MCHYSLIKTHLFYTFYLNLSILVFICYIYLLFTYSLIYIDYFYLFIKYEIDLIYFIS